MRGEPCSVSAVMGGTSIINSVEVRAHLRNGSAIVGQGALPGTVRNLASPAPMVSGATMLFARHISFGETGEVLRAYSAGRSDSAVT